MRCWYNSALQWKFFELPCKFEQCFLPVSVFSGEIFKCNTTREPKVGRRIVKSISS